MNVNRCMSTDVRVASPDETLQQAARAMKEIDTGVLPVGENDRLVGVITDRDIAVRAVAEGRGPQTLVREIMSRELLYCFEDESLEEVARQMRELQVRRLPVLNRNKRLVGIVSLGDLSRMEDIPQIIAGAFAGVCAPGGLHSQG